MTDTNLPTLVIAVGGVSGVGKTSLVQQVASQLNDAVALHFDDYAAVSDYPTNLAQWVSEGADPNQWRTPQLVEDLTTLRRGKAITLPVSKEILGDCQKVWETLKTR